MSVDKIAEAITRIIEGAWELLDRTDIDSISHGFDDDKGRHISVKISDEGGPKHGETKNSIEKIISKWKKY